MRCLLRITTLTAFLASFALIVRELYLTGFAFAELANEGAGDASALAGSIAETVNVTGYNLVAAVVLTVSFGIQSVVEKKSKVMVGVRHLLVLGFLFLCFGLFSHGTHFRELIADSAKGTPTTSHQIIGGLKNLGVSSLICLSGLFLLTLLRPGRPACAAIKSDN